jgi:putative aminopeptidase FrvX
MMIVETLKLLEELVAIPGPSGQERLVREALGRHLEALGLAHRTDAKGNLLVGSEKPRIVVTAHMDEIAMMVRRVEPDGTLAVGPLGGLFPWKLGEGPVSILTADPVNGILSFGSIHTEDRRSTVRRAETTAIDWDMASVITGLSPAALGAKSVRPGTRVVVHPSRRQIMRAGPLIASYFLDDRADLVSWLLALEELGSAPEGVLFAATAAEEVGGEGALYVLEEHRPEICIALELGPDPKDSPVRLTQDPAVWAGDSYSAMSYEDGELLARIGVELRMPLQFQVLSRGGSDASCAASHGLCARPITLGLPMANSHGFEVMHPDAMVELARLTVALVRTI